MPWAVASGVGAFGVWAAVKPFTVALPQIHEPPRVPLQLVTVKWSEGPIAGEAPRLATGLDPSSVAATVVTELLDGRGTEIAPEAFGAARPGAEPTG